jgi:serine protease Do
MGSPARVSGRLLALALLVFVSLALGAWAGFNWARRLPAGNQAAIEHGVDWVVARALPTVVKIEVETPRRRHNGRRLPDDHSLGSGVILDQRGYILTNRHVVHRAQRIEVTLSGDDRTYFAKLTGEDRESDLAVIQINAGRTLPAAKLGDSNQLHVGQNVVTIGSPFGLDDTVTSGIVSALNRNLDETSSDDPSDTSVNDSSGNEHYIQTDAAINPGNSGGPLLNLSGEVVGINTAIYTDTEGYQGVGFALPSALVQHIYPQLLAQGHVTRGSIGVYFESDLDPAVRRVYHLPTGVPIAEITAHGPAAVSGLEAGDVITSLNGASIDSGDQLADAIEFEPVGAYASVGYQRNGRAGLVKLKIADRSRLYPEIAGGARDGERPPQLVSTETPDLGLQLTDGNRVKSVAPDSFADRVGVRRGDTLVEINHLAVHDRADIERAASGARDIALVVRRPNGDGTYGRWLLGGSQP